MPILTRGAQRFLLGYCMNVHPTDELVELQQALQQHVIPLRQALCPDADMGVGLRISGKAANRLWFHRGDRARLRELLVANRLVGFTTNGYPLGNFNAGRVKADVYRPSWLEEARVNYTCQLSDVLVDLCGDVTRLTISTLAGAFRPAGDGPEVHAGIARNLVRAAIHMHKLRDRVGKEVMVCIEPEPFTTLETTAEVIRFFQDHVWVHGRRQVMDHLGVAEAEAEAVLKRHLGVCFDTCHQAVEFEDLPTSLQQLHAAGVPVGKVQLSCAVEIPAPGARPDLSSELRTFCEDRYFHQVVGRRSAGGPNLRCVDLPDLLADVTGEWSSCTAWRTHFHVPIHLASVGALPTTQNDLQAALRALVASGQCTHLEVETYTWDVLSPYHRQAAAGGELQECLRREMQWAMAQVTG